MVYLPYQWQNFSSGGTPITAERLNALEQGLADVSLEVSGRDGSPYGWANFLEDWHGLGDGVTDMSFGLNSALAAGGLLYLPPGDYLVSEQLYMRSTAQTILYGPGRIISTWNGTILEVNNAPHIIDGVTLQGAGASASNQTGIVVYAERAVLRNATITSVGACGALIAADNVLVENNTLDFCSLGTLVDDQSTSSIYVTGDHVKTINNTLTNTWTGITYLGVDGSAANLGGLIEGNRVAARADAIPSSVGIASQHSHYQRVSNNEVEGYPATGVYLEDGQFCIVADNAVHDGRGDGVFLGHGSTRHCSVSDNNITNVAIGIRIWDNAANIEVSGNSIADCSVGIVAYGSINSGELPLTNVRVEDNNITADGSQVGGLGIGVKNVDGFTVAQNTVLNANHQGVLVSGTSAIGMIRENTIRHASIDPAGSWAAIEIQGPAQQVLVDDNLLADGAEVAIAIGSGASGVRTRGNRWTNIATGVTDSGTGSLSIDDLAF